MSECTYEWQPIETAPRDGTIIDVWLGEASAQEIHFYCTPGTRRSTAWKFSGGRFRPAIGFYLVPTFVEPTHWKPIGKGPQCT